MGLFFALFDFDRKELITAAFAVLMVAAAVVSLGAWALLRRETRGDAARVGGAGGEERRAAVETRGVGSGERRETREGRGDGGC